MYSIERVIKKKKKKILFSYAYRLIKIVLYLNIERVSMIIYKKYATSIEYLSQRGGCKLNIKSILNLRKNNEIEKCFLCTLSLYVSKTANINLLVKMQFIQRHKLHRRDIIVIAIILNCKK